jgi:hypothetical protein
MAWKPDYVTATQLKSFLSIGDTADDAEIGYAITAASRAVDDHCNRQFGQVAAVEERRYTARVDAERGRYVVNIDDLQDVTGFAVEVDSVAVTAYELEPFNALVKGKPYTRLSFDPADVSLTLAAGEVYVTGKWGWSSVPTPVVEATLLQSSRLFNRRTSPYGIAGSPDAGSELRLLSRVDPDVGVSLRGYVRRRRVG